MIYLVSYDLTLDSLRNNEGLYGELENSKDWWHYLASTWLIVTDETAQQLAERLHKRMATQDRLLVVAISNDYSGYLSKEAWDWIRDALAREHPRMGPNVRVGGNQSPFTPPPTHRGQSGFTPPTNPYDLLKPPDSGRR